MGAGSSETPPVPMRPNDRIIARFAIRGVLLWLGVRLLASAVFKLAGVNPLHVGLWSTSMLIVACVAVGMVDLRRRHERILIANLGVSEGACVAFFAVPAIVAEWVLSALATAYP